MSDQENLKAKENDHVQVPDWLRTIQINSWEAELLISALLLYMLFQVPDFIENYRGQHAERGDITYLIMGIFITALKVLRIGYSLHIIARGIWVASVGLSYIYPKSLDQKRLKFKGKFKEEVENDQALDQTIKNLEKVASLSYSVSFMISGMFISVGLLFLYFFMLQEWIITPGLQNGNDLFFIVGFFGMFLYLMILLIIFIDFITNGVFRRESWAAKPYYYLALVFRYLTLSFIYNRIQMTIISNLPKWQARAVPFLAVFSIVGYMFVENKIDDWDQESYINDSSSKLHRMNYETMRKKGDPIFATIPDDVIDKGVIELYVETHGMMNRLYQKDDEYTDPWKQLSEEDQGAFADKYLVVSINDKKQDDLQWLDFKHPVSYGNGFMNYIDVSSLERGLHTIQVAIDTAVLNDLQKRVVKENDPYFVQMANIQFYKSQ